MGELQSAMRFAGLTFRGLHATDLYPQPGLFKFIVTVNADFIVRSAESARFADLISNNYATIDGQVSMWLARLLCRPRKARFEKVSGSSFAYDLLQHASEKGLRVFLLGACPTVNELATRMIRERYRIDAFGYSPPLTDYSPSLNWSEDAIAQIKKYSPHVLFVALGSPKQEYWIEDNRQALEASGIQVAIGCGGTLDFLAGVIPRAPEWVQRLGLEGFYRFAVQPSWFRLKRLARSFLVFPIAFWKCFSSRRARDL